VHFNSSSSSCKSFKYSIVSANKASNLDSKYAESIKLEDSKLTLNLEGTESITFYLMASSQSGNKAFFENHRDRF